jgi:cystathionine beta-lyase
MTSEFDKNTNRLGTDSLKWAIYGEDVIPLWVADMDFAAPEPVIEALNARIEHGVFGYGVELSELKELICERLAARHGWEVTKEAVVLLPGLVTGLNVACRAIGKAGDGVLVNTPVYPPFLSAPPNQERQLQVAEQAQVSRGEEIHYEVDLNALEDAVTPDTRLFILCNPHNPTGRVFSKSELFAQVEICARHEMIICSDEIHCDLLLGDAHHYSVAALDPEIEAKTITLLAPSKTFNIPGLGCSVAVIPNRELRARFKSAANGIVPDVNVLGMQAALAAYSSCDSWLARLRSYLVENRDLVADFAESRLPGVKTTRPEATYLAWLDCRELEVEEGPYRFFLKNAKVAMNNGVNFGKGGKGFVRLNFGCARSTLREALERMAAAIEEREIGPRC